EFFKKSLEIKPDDSSILYNYGIALRDSGDYLAAANAFKKSLLKDSENTQKLDCLAHVYMMLNDHEKAIETFGRSLRINPGQPETHSNLGSVYQAQGELSRAEACYRKALQLNPSLNIYDNLGSVLVSQGRYKESIEVYRAGLIKQPKNTRVFSNLLLTLNYMEDVSQQELYDEHNKWGDTFDNPLNYIAHHACDKNKEVLRIGYYSPDFREHSVAYFIEPIIEYHDKNKFKTYAYYSSKKEDAVTARLKGFFDVWRDASVMTDSELADAVKSDEIDIMVDLTGHTASNALLAFAKKPAPVQITYLGYPNTTGMKAIQYRITDAIADPEGQDIFYSEELCRLPECFLTYKPDDNSPDVSEPPVIQNGFITFGSFNNLAKINDKVIDVWCRILKRLPDSKLLVKNPSLTDLKTRETYIKKFQQFGIEGNRINLIGHTPTRNEHLSLYDKIDIALDTFPYNGTTTTCEALWMGVPVVALCGDYHAARVGASLLTAVNQKDLITNSEEEYIDKAASLAKNTDLLKYNRDRQRDYLQKSILFDGRAFVVSLENEYQRIWKSHS
ncbi:MAG: tetratricopeptide repeat protein, partial [Gammaproteobacteria bacterium]|nr:tetratricopeptide repeat protein [Gammaproteobacteria bacterium]